MIESFFIKNQYKNNLSENDTNKIIPEKKLWYISISAIIIYNIVAILIAQSQENFIGNGFVELENHIYNTMFYVFFFASLIQLTFLLSYNLNISGNIYPSDENTDFKKKLPRIKFVISDAMAIYGLVLFLIGGNLNHLIIFSSMGLLGMMFSYPKK